MSNISRRAFLKGAGVAALAVAAAGVLAGCSKDDIPDTPATMQKVPVIFFFGSGALYNEVAKGEVEVNVSQLPNGTISSSKLTLPEEVDTSVYYLKAGDCEIKNGVVYAELLQTATSKKQTVLVKFVRKVATGDQVVGQTYQTVDASAEMIDISKVNVPDGYKLDGTNAGDGKIVNGVVTIYVKKI